MEVQRRSNNVVYILNSYIRHNMYFAVTLVFKNIDTYILVIMFKV